MPVIPTTSFCDTPRVGMAVAIAIMMKMTASSPGRRCQLRLSSVSITWTVKSTTKNRMKAAGVQELRPMRVARITFNV